MRRRARYETETTMRRRASRRDGPSPARRMRGFTLFEVLAAALVLVLAGTLTIGSMSRNLAHLSDARLRLEAGRIADAALADLEATLFDGSAPPVSSDESADGPFRIVTRVAAFGALFDPAKMKAETEDGTPSFFSTIAGELPGLPQHLRILQVRVAWGRIEAPDFVERTTIAFDHMAALESLEKQVGAGAQEATQ